MSTLFSPLHIGSLTVTNRVWISPMCQYSATDGVIGPWHMVHLGSFATGGAGLIVAEATAVSAEGRISIGCPGIWREDQAEAWRAVTDFAHALGVPMAIQLAHAGRKASTMPPWSNHAIATEDEGGWQTLAPSPIAFPGYPEPRGMTVEEIATVVRDFADAARRALRAGFDVLEIHAAHGYLLHEFLSPLSNERTDLYGGDFDGRTKLLREVVQAVRTAAPSTPLFVRLSATDWIEGGWTIEESIALCRLLEHDGVDLIDVSSGGNVAGVTIPIGPGYQVPLATAIGEAVGIPVSAVGLITEPTQAEHIVTEEHVDAVMIARAAMRNPRWPLYAAEALGDVISWPAQLERARTVTPTR